MRDSCWPLPQLERDAAYVTETGHGVGVRAGELLALARSQPQRRMLARVEKLLRVYRPAEAVEHLEVDVVVGVRLRVDEVADANRSVRRLD